jgi:hypothetical protein
MRPVCTIPSPFSKQRSWLSSVRYDKRWKSPVFSLQSSIVASGQFETVLVKWKSTLSEVYELCFFGHMGQGRSLSNNYFSHHLFTILFRSDPLHYHLILDPAEFLMAKESRGIHSRALPNYERAEIIRSKIEGYALNPANDVGKNKARVFKSALGFDQSNWELLKQRILAELPYYEAKLGQTTQGGDSYIVDLLIEGPNGNIAKVRTVWQFRLGTDFPSLITVYVLPKSK